MKFFTLLLNVAFLAGIAVAVSGKNANEESSVEMLVAKPTEAPLRTSTVSPTRAPKIGPTPKPATFKATAKPNNAAKKPAPKVPAATTEKKIEMKMTEKSPMISEKEMKLDDAKPMAMPSTEGPQKSMDMKEAKPLAVTGFITQNGNIYEIEDTKGMGKIQGRQAEDVKEHICNYGSVVIYSDVPCEQVDNIKVSGVEEKPAFNEKPMETSVEKEQMKPEDNKDKETDDKEDLASAKPNKRRQNNKRRNKNKNQKAKLQQQKKNKNRRNRNGVNRPNNNNQNRRRLQQQQQRPNQQNRRQQQKQQLTQQQKRRQQQNRREWQDDQRELQNQRRRNQKRRQQANRQRFDEYDDEE